MSNVHVEAFMEALVFGDECGRDMSAMENNANQIVAELLISCALAVQTFDALPDNHEGAAAFVVAIVAIFNEDHYRNQLGPTLQAFADKIRENYPCN